MTKASKMLALHKINLHIWNPPKAIAPFDWSGKVARSQLDILSELITVAKNIEIQGLVTQVQASAEVKTGTITIQGIVVDKLRKIHIQLNKTEYNVALKAYSERLPIICTGDLIKEGDSFLLKNPRNFGLYPEEETN